jgi:hypothetical protein
VVGFEVSYLDQDAGEVRVPLADVAALSFELAPPVRSFPSFKGQRNYPGWYFASSLAAHVGYESWFERDEAMALDFDQAIACFASQPFWLYWPDAPRPRSHAPDFFARAVDGTGIDCRPKDRIKPRDQAAFDATEKACAQVGWRFRLVTGHDPVWLGNLQWLAGYRHERYRLEPAATALIHEFTAARPLIEGACAVGDPIAVLPVLYHLLWAGELAADLTVRLEAVSPVVMAPS